MFIFQKTQKEPEDSLIEIKQLTKEISKLEKQEYNLMAIYDILGINEEDIEEQKEAVIRLQKLVALEERHDSELDAYKASLEAKANEKMAKDREALIRESQKEVNDAFKRGKDFALEQTAAVLGPNGIAITASLENTNRPANITKKVS